LPSESNICPFLDIEFNKTFGFTRKLVGGITGFFVSKGENELSDLLTNKNSALSIQRSL
jgi:hypothetical protein